MMCVWCLLFSPQTQMTESKDFPRLSTIPMIAINQMPLRPKPVLKRDKEQQKSQKRATRTP